MKFWQALSFTEIDQLVDVAKICDEVGFHGVFVSDHVVYPEKFEPEYPYAEDGRPAFDATTEWPDSWVGARDIDSGTVIPMLDVSAGASGMAFLAASGFRDAEYLQSLLATIDFAAMPAEVDGQLRYCASNQVGDAVLLYSLAQGPLWRKIGRQR